MAQQWNLCILSSLMLAEKEDFGAQMRAQIVNALFYGDTVNWITLDREAVVRSLAKTTYYPENWRQNDDRRYVRRAVKDFYQILGELETYTELDGKLGCADICIPVPGTLGFLSGRPVFFTQTSDSGCPHQKLISDLTEKACSVLGNGAESTWLSDYYCKPTATWNTYHATQVLLEALNKVILPDLGSLPFEEMFAWREIAKDELARVRAHMQKLSASLRSKVDCPSDQESLIYEAINLIQSEIEPAVIDARAHLEIIRKNRSKKTLSGLIHSLALLCYGLKTGDVSFGTAGINKAVRTAAETISEPSAKDSLSAVARMVLKIEGLTRNESNNGGNSKYIVRTGDDVLLYDPVLEATIHL